MAKKQLNLPLTTDTLPSFKFSGVFIIFFPRDLKYGHVLMVVNTSLRSINSVSEHGNMVTL